MPVVRIDKAGEFIGLVALNRRWTTAETARSQWAGDLVFQCFPAFAVNATVVDQIREAIEHGDKSGDVMGMHWKLER